jgi:hypothetical protein
VWAGRAGSALASRPCHCAGRSSWQHAAAHWFVRAGSRSRCELGCERRAFVVGAAHNLSAERTAYGSRSLPTLELMSDRVLNPRLERALRTAGVWAAALMLPFVLLAVLGRLLLGLVFPAWLRRSDAARRKERAEVRQWQEAQLTPYRTRSYAELCALPSRSELIGPERFRNYRFTLERKLGDAGGVDVAVRAAQRVVWPLWAADSASFEMLETGQIAEEVPYDDSDQEL